MDQTVQLCVLIDTVTEFHPVIDSVEPVMEHVTQDGRGLTAQVMFIESKISYHTRKGQVI